MFGRSSSVHTVDRERVGMPGTETGEDMNFVQGFEKPGCLSLVVEMFHRLLKLLGWRVPPSRRWKPPVEGEGLGKWKETPGRKSMCFFGDAKGSAVYCAYSGTFLEGTTREEQLRRVTFEAFLGHLARHFYTHVTERHLFCIAQHQSAGRRMTDESTLDT